MPDKPRTFLHLYPSPEELLLLRRAAEVMALPLATWAKGTLVREARRVLEEVLHVVDR